MKPRQCEDIPSSASHQSVRLTSSPKQFLDHCYLDLFSYAITFSSKLVLVLTTILQGSQRLMSSRLYSLHGSRSSARWILAPQGLKLQSSGTTPGTAVKAGRILPLHYCSTTVNIN